MENDGKIIRNTLSDTSLVTADFDYTLPEELIAQTPLEKRDDSRLMVLDALCYYIVYRNEEKISGLLSEDERSLESKRVHEDGAAAGEN